MHENRALYAINILQSTDRLPEGRIELECHYS